jgi:stage II sporulation protein M
LLTGIKRSISIDIADNRLQYLLLVFFIVVGITSGTFTVSHMQPGEKTALTGYMDTLLTAIKTQSVDYLSVLLHAFLQNTLMFGAITLFSLLMVGIPVIPVILIIKGFCVGFAVGVFSLNFGFAGVAAIIFCVFIPNIVLIPCICKAGVLGINNSIFVLKNRKIPNTAKERLISSKPHISKMMFVYLISLIGVIFETLLTPALIKLM